MSSIMACSSPPLASTSIPLTWRGVLSSSVRPERLGQPAGRVDGEHHRAPAVLLGGPQRQRRGGGGLAHSARTAAHDDPHAGVGEDLVDVQLRRRVFGRHQSSVSGWVRSMRPCRAAGVSQSARRAACGQTSRARPGPPRRAAAAARPSAGPAPPGRRAATPPAPGGSAGRGPRRAGRPRCPGRPAARRRPARARSSAWVTLPAASSGGRAPLTITRPTGMPSAVSSAIASTVSWTGISSSSVTTCTAVIGERSSAATPSLWVLIGPTLASRAVSAVTLRNRPIRPVGGASSTTASYARRCAGRAGGRLLDLAGEQHVAQAGGDGGGEVDGAELAQRPAGRAQLVEHVQVFEERLLGVHRQGAHLAAAGRRRRSCRSSYGSGSMPNSWAMPCRPSTSTSRVRRPPAASAERQRGRHAGLAGAALAGHHVQAGRPSPRRPGRPARSPARTATRVTSYPARTDLADPPAGLLHHREAQSPGRRSSRRRWSWSAWWRPWPASAVLVVHLRGGPPEPGRSGTSSA